MKKLGLLLSMSFVIFLSGGCGLLGESKDPKTPDGAWNLFVDNMKNKNYDGAWNILTDETKKDFEYVFSLVTTLFAQLPPEDKKDMEDIFRQEIGDVPLNNPKDLLTAEFGDIDESTLAGAKIDSKVIQGNTCIITTKAAQTFTMQKSGDNWYLNYTPIKEARKDFETALNNFGIPLPLDPGVTSTTPITTQKPGAASPATPGSQTSLPPPAIGSGVTGSTKPMSTTAPSGPKSPAPKPPPPIVAGKH